MVLGPRTSLAWAFRFTRGKIVQCSWVEERFTNNFLCLQTGERAGVGAGTSVS